MSTVFCYWKTIYKSWHVDKILFYLSDDIYNVYSTKSIYFSPCNFVIFQIWCWFESWRFWRRPNFKRFERRFLQLERRKLRSVRRRLLPRERGRVHGPADLLLQNVHAVRICHAQKWGAADGRQAVRSGLLLVVDCWVVKCFWLINQLQIIWPSNNFLKIPYCLITY